MKQGAPHWSPDELIQAAVEMEDMAPDRQAHLESCPLCRSRLNQLQGRLTSLGRTAAALAPTPRRVFRLPVHVQPASPAGRRIFGPVTALVLSTLLLMIVVERPHWAPYLRRLRPPMQAIEEPRFSRSLDALVENALPAPYQQLTAFREPEVDGTQAALDMLDGLWPFLIEDDSVISEDDIFS